MPYLDFGFKILPFFIVLLSLYYVYIQKNCHTFTISVHQHLGSKTPYRMVANFNSEPLTYPGCKGVKMWSLFRHGTRTPKAKSIRIMNEKLDHYRTMIVNNIDKGQGELCPDVSNNFQNWKFNLAENNSLILTEEGEKEMFLIGERMLLRFPELLSYDYNNDTYKFRYTATQRTMMSANQFASGLFGRQVSKHVWYPEALDKDPILRFYKLCEKWKKTVNKNPATYIEQMKFLKSPEVSDVVEKLSKRLGFGSPLEFDDVFLMYQMCRFETAFSSENISPWCSILSKDDAQVFEYYEDLKYYWKDGYGYPLNYEQACPAFNDMIQYFKSESSEPKGVFYFTHSGTILKMLSFLKLYKDAKPLLSSDFKNNFDRQWKLSAIDSFGSNLVFVLYECSDGIKKILVLHQEQPVKIPGCPDDHILCSFNLFTNIYKSGYSNCNFNEMCSI